MTTSGVVTRYERPAIADPSGIVAGVDGALWFTNSGNNTIGRITTGGTVTSFSDPSLANPQDITTGPDGALWFTNPSNNSIGRIVAADATHTPSSPVQCKHGGWRALTDELGDPFRNEGQCVSWTNHHL
jgi:virginiamycin B lyase